MELSGRGGPHSRSRTFPPARSTAGSRRKARGDRTGGSFSGGAAGGRITRESRRIIRRNRFATARRSTSGASGWGTLRGTWSWANPAPADCSPWWIDGHVSSVWNKSTTKRRDTSTRSFGKRCRSSPADKRHSTTFDHGTEFARCHLVEKTHGTKRYFADPGCPQQRGTNENTNTLLRQFFPKGIDFRTITWADMRRVETLINNRPRKCLGYRTPAEVFRESS